MEDLARSVLQQPLRVTVGERNTAVASVRQRLLFVGRENGKLLALRQLLGGGLKPPVLVFVSSKERAKVGGGSTHHVVLWQRRALERRSFC